MEVSGLQDGVGLQAEVSTRDCQHSLDYTFTP